MNVNVVSIDSVGYSNSVRKKNFSKNQSPMTSSQAVDSVSFKSKIKMVEKPTMKFFSKLMLTFSSLLGVKVAKDAVEKTENIQQTPQPVNNTPLTKAQQLEQELTNKTYTYTYGRDGDYTATENSFNGTAVKGIVELYETEGAEPAYRLAKLLEKESEATEGDTQYVIDKFKTNPEIVDKYKVITSKSGRKIHVPLGGVAKLMLAAEIDTDLTDKTVKRFDEIGTSPYKSSFDKIYEFVSAAQEHSPKAIEKYLNEDRIRLDLDNVLVLSGLDKEYSKEIGEILSTLGSINKGEIERTFIQDILQDYVKNKDVVDLIIHKLGRADALQVRPLIEAFEAASGIAIEMCEKVAKYDSVRIAGVNSEKAAALTLGVHNNAEKIEQLTGKSWKELPISQLEEILDVIQNNSDVIDRIIVDGRGKDYKSLIDIYRRNPDREITQEFIDLAKDPLAQLFDLP